MDFHASAPTCLVDWCSSQADPEGTNSHNSNIPAYLAEKGGNEILEKK